MINNFVREVEEVRFLMNVGENQKALDLCIQTIETIEQENTNDKSNLWFFNLRLGMCHRRLRQCDKAIKYIKISQNNCETTDQLMDCWWMIGGCYDTLNQKQKAIKFYEKCQDYFERNNNREKYLYMAFNIARLKKNSEEIWNIIDEYKQLRLSEKSINNAYETLFEIYILKNAISKAANVINYITDINIKTDLQGKIDRYNMSAVL